MSSALVQLKKIVVAETPTAVHAAYQSAECEHFLFDHGPAIVKLIEWSQRLTKQLAHLRDSGLQDHDAELYALGLKPVEINQAYDETVAALAKLTEHQP